MPEVDVELEADIAELARTERAQAQQYVSRLFGRSPIVGVIANKMASGNDSPLNDGDINGLQAFIDNALDGLESTELTQEQRDAVVEMLSEFETEVLDLYERQQQDLQQAQPEASQADGAPPDY